MAGTLTHSVYTLSDLHLFCKRSEAHHHIGRIHQALDKADVFVLNGDIFDFKWTTLRSIEETVDAAIHWLRRFMGRARQCEVHYILGNHDNHVLFVEALNEFAEERPNFSWHAHYVRLGNCLFLHGDVSMRKMTTVDLVNYRRDWQHKSKRGRVLNRVWDAAFNAGVHIAVPRFAFPNQRVVERLDHYIDHIGHGADSGTERVFFGHTHVAVNDYCYRGMRYFNCGAPMRGLTFNILNTEVTLEAA